MSEQADGVFAFDLGAADGAEKIFFLEFQLVVAHVPGEQLELAVLSSEQRSSYRRPSRQAPARAAKKSRAPPRALVLFAKIRHHHTEFEEVIEDAASGASHFTCWNEFLPVLDFRVIFPLGIKSVYRVEDF